MLKRKKPNTNYVDKEVLLEQIVNFQKEYKKAEEMGNLLPRIPDTIGKAIIDTTDGIGSRPNFRNYTWLEDMKGDAIKDCTRAVMSFDPEKGKNPFGYFSRVIWYAFLGRIEKEKKIQKAKIDSMFDPTQKTFDVMPGDTTHYQDHMDEISDFYYRGKLKQ